MPDHPSISFHPFIKLAEQPLHPRVFDEISTFPCALARTANYWFGA